MTEPMTHKTRSKNVDWNESYYFVFYDHKHEVGGMSRVGFKPNRPEGMTFLFLFLPDGTVAAYHTTDEGKEYPTAIRVDGVHHQHLGSDKWRYTFDGSMVLVDNSEILPRVRERPDLIKDLVDVSMNLDFSALNEPYEYSEHMTAESLKIGKKSGDRHWEQIAKITGTLNIGSTQYRIANCLGQRDHTYGIRDWTGIGDWFYFVVWFDEAHAVNPAAVITQDGKLGSGGFLYRDGRNVPIKHIRLIEHRFRPDGMFPASTTLELIDDEAERHVLKGQPGRIIPVPFKDEQGNEAVLVQSFGTFELDGIRSGYGAYEVLKRGRHP